VLHAMHLILLNTRAHQAMTERERQQREFKVIQWPKRGMQQLLFEAYKQTCSKEKKTRK